MVYEHFNLITRVGETKGKTLLNLGCGGYQSDVARQIQDMPLKLLVGVDCYKPDLDAAKKLKFMASAKKHILCDVTKYKPKQKYDIVLVLDLLEHIEKKRSVRFLQRLERWGKKIVIFVPLEPDDFRRTNPDKNNPAQEHISLWREHEFKSMGYKTERITGMHSEEVGAKYNNNNYVDNHRIVWDGLWAIKNTA